MIVKNIIFYIYDTLNMFNTDLFWYTKFNNAISQNDHFEKSFRESKSTILLSKNTKYSTQFEFIIKL